MSIEPTDSQLAADAAALLTEVDGALCGDRWAFIRPVPEHAEHRFYSGAALRHCCECFAEIEVAAKAGRELAVRTLGRAQLEALLYALYLHFGGTEALTRIKQDTLHSLMVTDRDNKEFDARITKQTSRAKERLVEVRRANAAISEWNRKNSSLPARPLLTEPHVPLLTPSGMDLAKPISNFGSLKPRKLPLEQVVSALTKLGPQKGFSFEDFAPLYLAYRLMSGIGPHPNASLYDSYITGSPGYVRIEQRLVGHSVTWNIRVTGLYGTAYLAGAVMHASDQPTPVADRILEDLEESLTEPVASDQ